jgi:hypothetical protein
MSEGMDKAKKFVKFFYMHIRDGGTAHVTTMYEMTFPRISADFFPDKSWPHPDALKHLVDDYVFWMLYTVCPTCFRLYTAPKLVWPKQSLHVPRRLTF